jgi:hypothetical protein
MRLFLSLVGCFLLLPSLPAQTVTGGVDQDLLARLLQRHRPTAERFHFALIGDQQYGAEGIRKWPALQAHINADRDIRFTVHTGDIKNGSTTCDDGMFANRLESFNAFLRPMILTPGDNEWTDCHRANNGSYDALERLAYLRRIFYPNNQSLGREKLTLTQQIEDPRFPKFVENAMWSSGNILFATVHIIGSNNNLGRNTENDREYEERNLANLYWIKTAFSVARDNGFAGVVLVIQANLNLGLPATNPDRGGFNDTIFVLEQEALAYGKPIMLVHGDSHIFGIDKTFRSARSNRVIENITRVEVFGSEDVHWTKVLVDPTSEDLFWYQPKTVSDNLVNHRQ